VQIISISSFEKYFGFIIETELEEFIKDTRTHMGLYTKLVVKCIVTHAVSSRNLHSSDENILALMGCFRTLKFYFL